MQQNPKLKYGIYIHIPFCLQKCHYCSFYSINNLSLEPVFIDALIKEIKIKASDVNMPCNSIYIGGGTPSVLQTNNLIKILEAVFKYFIITPDSEITIEANPGTLNNQVLKDYYNIGINRINIGVQSFQNHHLKFLGRIHSVLDIKYSLQWAKSAGFNNIGIDLIYGLPEQSKKLWADDLKKAAAWNIDHLSCYMLTYEPETLLYEKLKSSLICSLNEDKLGDMFEFTIKFLADIGYEQYEISNFSKSKEKRSQHNQKYWAFKPYIGLGPSAHSFMNNERSWNQHSLTKYIKAVKAGKNPIAGMEILTKEQQIIETIYLGFRKTEGINIKDFNKKFNLDFNNLFKDILIDLKTNGFIKDDAGSCALSLKGMRFMDSITSLFICKKGLD